MATKRPFVEGSEVPCQDPKRQLTYTTFLRDSINGSSLHEFVSTLEPFFRKWVREEVEHTIRSSLRLPLNETEPSDAKAWHLHFDCRLPSTVFTNTRLESEDNKPIKVVILDASLNIITSGPLSSLKVEIIVIDGDFGADKNDWTEKEFSAKIVREREGKRPLVTGNLIMSLTNGVGYIEEVSFTDNSSWIRSRKFRLAARVHNISERRIREAISEAFVVKDHRGESYKKHHPPYLHDEIWRLEKIAKDGAFNKRLASNGILTVKDFLRLYVTNPNSLRNILGSGISKKTWDVITEHANTCILDDEMLHIYYRAGQRIGLLFNSIFRVVAATFDGENYHSLATLDACQLRWVEDLKQHAYKNTNDIVPVGGQPYPMLLVPQGDPSSCANSVLHNVNFSVAQDQQEMQLFSSQTTAAPQCTYATGDSSQVEVSRTTLMNGFDIRDSDYEPYGGGCSWSPSEALGPVMLMNHLSASNNADTAMSSTWLGNVLFSPPSNQAADDFSSPRLTGTVKPKARWCKVRAIIKWGICVRRRVAAKRFARFLYRSPSENLF